MVGQIFPTLIHNGITFVTPYPTPNYTYDTINDNITGFGTYVINANGQSQLSFLHGVAAGQNIIMNGSYVTNASSNPVREEVVIGDPKNFHGHINMNYVEIPQVMPWRKAPPGWEQLDIAINMLGRAVDSYSYKNDMLSLWSGSHVVQTLSLTVRDPYGITVQAAPGPYIFISANDRTNHGLGFLNQPPNYWPGMPVHI
jgi:hypothetical protein